MFKLVAVLFVFRILAGVFGKTCDGQNPDDPNNRPVVGILAQTYYGHYKDYHKGYAYIAASYVKFVEMAGARAVPIMVNHDESYYKKMISQINGLLLPGGGQYLNDSAYSTAGKILWDLAVELNTQGDHFPVWGTCLGFEAMMYFQMNDTNYLSSCEAYDLASPLNLIKNPRDSRLFKSMDDNLQNIITKENVTVNYHRNCLRLRSFEQSGLSQHFSMLSVNTDIHKLEYISSVESIKFPFYGVQFHPEKNAFEFILNEKHQHTPHSYSSILVTQYFANFFINETRRNQHCFKNQLEENKALIYNTELEFTGFTGVGSFDSLYFFQISASYLQKFSYALGAILAFIVIFI